jgi:DNA invertase Pin-like site-specific DNA recombinase
MAERGTSMAEPIESLVAYYRVSTAQQGASGLGLEGQVAAVEQYARDRGAAILRAYREVDRRFG